MVMGSSADVVVISRVPTVADVPADPVEMSGVGRSPARVITGVDLATGQDRWSVRTPAGAQATVAETADQVERLIEVDEDGRTALRDLRTGEVLATTTVEASRAADIMLGPGDLVIIGAAGDGPGSAGAYVFSAFSLVDGHLRWRRGDLAGGYLVSCGRWLCEFGQWATSVLDPATGVTRWRTDQPGWGAPTDTDVILGNDRSGDPGLAIADTATGRVDRRWARWRPVMAAAPDVHAVMQGDDVGGGLVGVLDPSRRELSLIGVVPPGVVGTEDLACLTVGGYLACRGGRSMLVWRLPAPGRATVD
jgi:hypothetical protein